MLQGKTVLLGVTGSIAAYKIAYLASALKKLHAQVHVLMTQNATNFINPITFETLTGNKCLVDTFDRNFQFSVEHVSIAKQADVVMIFNLAVGLCTPPVGSALFVGCAIGKTPIERTAKNMLPLYATMVIVLLLVTYVPDISLLLPRLLKL